MVSTVKAYARISRDPGERRIGVQRQRREVTELAERLGLHIDTWHEDNDASAFSGKVRPAFDALLRDLEAGRVAALLAWDQDRVARDIGDWERVLRACQKHATRVAFTTSGEVDIATVSGRTTSRFNAVIARQESEHKSERIKAASRERAAEGRAHGLVPYGWRREYETDARGLRIKGAWHDVLDEHAAEVVREAARRVLAGESAKRIVSDLNDRGIPTVRGRPWDPAALRMTLLRPGNAGLRVHQGKVVGAATAPAILNRGDWDRLVALLRDPSRRTVTDNRIKHLLTGIAKCGVCGAAVRVKGPRYLCPKSHVGRLQDPVDDLVERVVVGRLSMPDAATLLAADDAVAEQAAQEAAALRVRLDALVDDYADGLLDRDGMKRATARIRPRLEVAEAKARATSSAATDVLADVVGPDAQAHWDTLPIARRRAVISTLLDVEILPIGDKTLRRAPFDPELVRLTWRGVAQ
jgi:DNA invertase Pin-like site-specific DNA recombinase